MEQYQKRGYLLERFRLFHLHTLGGEKVEYHYHEFCKILLILSGKGSYVVDGQRYLLQPGDAVLVNSHSVHCPELEADTPYERIIIYVAPDFLQQHSTESCRLLDCFAGDGNHVLRLREDRRRSLFALAARLERELDGDDYGREILSEAALLRLLVELGRARRGKDGQPAPVAPQSSRVLGMMRYMDEHLADDLDVEQLAEQFYVSKYHMMRQFRQETGFTVHTYLLQRRLLHARILIDGGMRATEAGYRSGFRSYSTFTRAYAKHFGTTPTGRIDRSREREEGFE